MEHLKTPSFNQNLISLSGATHIERLPLMNELVTVYSISSQRYSLEGEI
jgi:hypothetical protein